MPAPGYSAYVAPDEVRPARPRGASAAASRRRAGAGCSTGRGAARPGRHAAHAAGAGRRRGRVRGRAAGAGDGRFADLSNRTNPRMPLVSELTELLLLGYDGERTCRLTAPPRPWWWRRRSTTVLATIRDVESQADLDPRDPRGGAARGLRGRRAAGHRALQGVRHRGHRRVHAVLRAHRRHHELDDAGGPHADRAGGLLHAAGARRRRDRGHLRADHPPQRAAARVRPPPGDLGADRGHPDRPAQHLEG